MNTFAAMDKLSRAAAGREMLVPTGTATCRQDETADLPCDLLLGAL